MKGSKRRCVEFDWVSEDVYASKQIRETIINMTMDDYFTELVESQLGDISNIINGKTHFGD